jgi:hypothetical protein
MFTNKRVEHIERPDQVIKCFKSKKLRTRGKIVDFVGGGGRERDVTMEGGRMVIHATFFFRLCETYANS